MHQSNISKQQQIMRGIINNSPISKRELQKATGMSWGMVSNIVHTLEEEKYIIPCTKETSSVGRKADKYDIRSDEHYCFGIDLNYNSLSAVVTDMKGRVVEQLDRVFQEREKEYVLNQIFTVLDLFFERYKDKEIRGIGFSVQGILDIHKGISNLISGISDWVDIPLVQMSEERYHVRCYLENDANCIMKYEKMCGCMKDRNVQEALLVTYDSSVGAGMSIITRGQICRGNNGLAGEIGCMPTSIEDDGKFRYLESYVTVDGMLREYFNRTGKKIKYSQFEYLLTIGDDDATAILKSIERWFGMGMSTIVNILNPQVCVLHMVGIDGRLISTGVTEIIKKISYDKKIEVALSVKGQEGKAIGAALTVSEHAIRQM